MGITGKVYRTRGKANEGWDREEGGRALTVRARNEIYNTKRGHFHNGMGLVA